MKTKWQITEREGFTPQLILYIGEDCYVCTDYKKRKGRFGSFISNGEIEIELRNIKRKRK